MAGKVSDETQRKVARNAGVVMKLAKRKSGVTPAEILKAIEEPKVSSYHYRQVLKAAKDAGLQVQTVGRMATYKA